MCLSAPLVYVGTVMRFRYRKYNIFWMLSIISFALALAANYHSTHLLWEFGVHWIYFASLASATLLIVMSLVLPQYAGKWASSRVLNWGGEGAGSRMHWAAAWAMPCLRHVRDSRHLGLPFPSALSLCLFYLSLIPSSTPRPHLPTMQATPFGGRWHGGCSTWVLHSSRASPS